MNLGVTMKNIFYYNPQKKLRSSIEYLYGIRSEKELNFLTNNSFISNRIPQNMQIIGEYIVTNKILMSVKGKDYGKIYYWDHEMEAGEGEKPDYSNLTLIADSFEEFINSLKSEEDS
jgi:SMI1 / KNR4 family (SUKH-1)